MKPKDRSTARCPGFIARTDYQRIYWIQCKLWRILYFDKSERDNDYRVACCSDPAKCPINRVPNTERVRVARMGRRPAFWPLTTKYPTIQSLQQEMQNHER